MRTLILATIFLVLVAVAIGRSHPRKSGNVPAVGPESGPTSEVLVPGCTEAKLRAQEQHILELRKRIETLEARLNSPEPAVPAK